MKKLEKFLILPVMCHSALLLTVVIMELMKNSIGGFVAMIELCGVIVTPMLYAVMSIANAILYDSKVSENFVKCVLYLIGIGIARIVLYIFLAPSGVLLSVGALIVSVAIFSLWEALFALTDKMMKRKRTPKSKKTRKK